MTASKYDPGCVLDLSFKSGRMPDRIFIDLVYCRYGSKEWMYKVYSEMNDEYCYIGESEIDKRISDKSAKCYDNKIIIDMYKQGFRFAGNNKSETAFNRARRLQEADYIKNIVLLDAIDKDGNNIQGQLGLWVRYANPIDDDKFRYSGEFYQVK